MRVHVLRRLNHVRQELAKVALSIRLKLVTQPLRCHHNTVEKTVCQRTTSKNCVSTHRPMSAESSEAATEARAGGGSSAYFAVCLLVHAGNLRQLGL